MPCGADLNCTAPDGGAILPFDGDPDVAGIGVIISFLVSAWLTFVFLVAASATTIPKEGLEIFWKKLRQHLSLVARQSTIKSDTRIASPVKPQEPQKGNRTLPLGTIQEIALTLSDQQLITGASILIAGYSRHCIITQYHFYIVFIFGITSLTTHQMAMMICRDKLGGSFFKKFWRTLWIIATLALVLAASLVILNGNYLTHWGLSTQCVWDDLSLSTYSASAKGRLAASWILLTWGLLATIRDLWPGLFKDLEPLNEKLLAIMSLLPIYYWASKKLSESRRKSLLWLLWWFTSKFALAIFITCYTLVRLYHSTVLDILRDFVLLMISTLLIVVLRSSARSHGLQGSEDSWGFGQILPMLLLALPLFQIGEMLSDNWHSMKKSKKLEHKGSTPLMEHRLSDTGPDHPSSLGRGDDSRDGGDSSLARLPDRVSTRKDEDGTQVHDGVDEDTDVAVRPNRVDTEGGRESISANITVKDSKPTQARTQERDEYEAMKKRLNNSDLFSMWLVMWTVLLFAGIIVGALYGIDL